MTNCGFTLLPCLNECKEDNETIKLLRKDIEAHKKEVCPRRQYKCLHCQESGEYRERTTTHLEECPKMKIPCPNDGCDEKIKRCDILEHRQECLYEEVSCKYTNIGCKKKFLRKDLEDHHNDSQQHLQLAIDEVNQQKTTIETLKDKVVHLKQTAPMKFRITGFEKLKNCNKEVYSPSFYTSPGGYKMCISVYANGNGRGKGTHVSVFAYLMLGENDDHLPWSFTGTVTVELLNQLENDNHYSDKITFPPDDDEVGQRVVNKERVSSGYGTPCYISHFDLGYIAANNCQYLKDDCLYFRVKVEAQSTSKPWLV